MVLERWLQIAIRHRTVLVLGALLTTLAGADLLLNRPKGSGLQWFAIPFLACGAALFACAVLPKGGAPAMMHPSLAARVLHLLTWRGRLVPYFPIIGIAVVVADLAYNATVSATPQFLTEDTIVLLGASALIMYALVPSRFARERDFVLVFLVMLNAILVVPLLITRAFYADFERSVDVYSWVALAPQTGAILSLLGIGNTIHPVSGSTAPGLTFKPQNFVGGVTIVITTACSGIYSLGIFASAFVAFVLTEFEKPSLRIWALLTLGVLTSYVANILRMVAIVLVGYFTDSAQTDLQNMLIAHSYAGWIIFLGWIALFWGILLRLMPIERQEGIEDASRQTRPEVRCGICREVLTPTIPADRCACGAYHHRACIAALESCPACGKTTEVGKVLVGW